MASYDVASIICQALVLASLRVVQIKAAADDLSCSVSLVSEVGVAQMVPAASSNVLYVPSCHCLTAYVPNCLTA
jgi:hypothetical protein